jgi:hypothetical protein
MTGYADKQSRGRQSYDKNAIRPKRIAEHN